MTRPLQTPARAATCKLWQRDLLGQLRRRDIAIARGARLHLAVFVEPYLGMILDGRKTLESRFARTRKPPYQCAGPGDLVALKRSSGPVVAVCTVMAAHFHELDPRTLLMLRLRYAEAIGDSSNAFWSARRRMRYASLLQLDDVRLIDAFELAKIDRRGWVVIEAGT